MFEQINGEFEQLQQGIGRKNKITAMLESLRKQLSDQMDLKASYEKELEKEQLDVDKLNKMSLTNLFYTILRSKEEQMDKEYQEVLAAKLKLDNIINQIEDTQNQISNLESEKRNFNDFERRYEKLMKEKYELYKQVSSANADKVTELEQTITLVKSNVKETQEAIQAGNRVISQLNQVEKSLNSAHGWGTWDMWGGGGLVTDMIKHSHIDDARADASAVQSLLNQFRTELADVHITSQIHIDIEGFSKFADFFFDGLISDWVVQSKINDSLSSVSQVRNQVNQVLVKLQTMQNSDKGKVTSLENELNQLIKNA
ncbi:MAG: hypothetical protein K0S41_3312 [Anaerocolumna sp.]|jgi:hypothetical protein|nr:hypothetical protein [Anaerocolumna sp.]